jgi:hypothetical protein
MAQSDKPETSGNELARAVKASNAAAVEWEESSPGGGHDGLLRQVANVGRKTGVEKFGGHDNRRRTVNPAVIRVGSGLERSERRRAENPATRGHAPRWQSNVKHQRARATESRAKERSRCARSAACASSTALRRVIAPAAATTGVGHMPQPGIAGTSRRRSGSLWMNVICK